MHKIVKNLIAIENNIKNQLNNLKKDKLPKIIAVSKTFTTEKIIPLIEHGHIDFGENKVQEANEKWNELKSTHKNINLHMIGRLQSNKVKQAVKIFDYIHTVDSKKIAKKINDEMIKIDKEIKIFIQVNIGNEDQKSGVNIEDLLELFNYCIELNLNVIGLMCIPPVDKNPEKYFKEMNKLNQNLNINELSMGMSNDYLDAIKYSSTYVRIGSLIFGSRN